GLAAVFTFGMALLPIRAGDIVGTVSDKSNQGTLPGASVVVVENGRKEISDGGGQFRISGLAAGSYTLRVDYVGYEAKTVTVTVPATGETPVAVTMGEAEIVKL